jgi:hypothetical protein
MAQKTALGVGGWPGGLHTFTPKTPEGGGPHPVEKITALGVGGWPRGFRTFVAKTPEGGGPHPVGHITALGVGGWPGGFRTYTAKTPEAVPPFEMGPPEIGKQYRHGFNRYRVLQWGGKYPPGSR